MNRGNCLTTFDPVQQRMVKGGNMDILKSIEEAVVKRDIEGAKALTQKALDQKIPPNDILNKGSD